MEFRKLISFGKTSFVMSIPKSWVTKNNLKKGDLIALEEEKGDLILSPNVEQKKNKKKTTKIDITGIDRTSVLYVIRSAYKMGCDEIELIYNKPLAKHYRKDKEEKIISIIHEEVNRLVGIEVVQQKDNFCIIRDLSENSAAEFDSALRRVFLLLNDASNDLKQAVKDRDNVLLDTIEEKHNSITKFVSYCLRLINKGKFKDPQKSMTLYHIISNLDKITDILKYSARDIREQGNKLKKESRDIIEKINESIITYYELFYKFDFSKSSKLYEDRDDIIKDISVMSKKLPGNELLILEKAEAILELITDLSEARMAMEHN
ncbi:AbrB/MazE/SpoVT family DNA-binding domain-containing protein [Candidatus Woesearchaeota archaeon]|nr:AbrB/MazE/SpoVT family DNA-binding domain-containing protein [Candidatus Woesearchaeota archaeon]